MRIGIGTGGQVTATDFTPITSGEGNKTQPRWSPDGSSLLFVAPGGMVKGKNLGLDIWKMDVDGGEAVDLTQRVGDDTDPAWSPDGKTIAFSNNGREDGVRQIFFMNPDGSQQSRISLDFNESAPIWAPDMKWLVYVISANNYPFLYMRSSKESYKTPEPYDYNEINGRLGQVSQPAWSPDGNQIAYVRLDGGNKQVWSVIFASRGGDLAQLTKGSADMDPAWSPDSRWILYSSMKDGNREIYLMTSAGTLQTNLTNDGATDQQPAWQPLSTP
jgi:TolB protein